MTAPEPSPTAEHIDAVARALLVQWAATSEKRTAQSPLDHCRDFSRAILTPTDPAVHLAMLDALVRAGVLTEEWALRYEHDTDPTMDDPSGVRTQTSRVASRAIAEQAVATRVPGGTIRNRRAERQYVTRWEVAP